MQISTTKVLSQNITLAYAALDLQRIDSRSLKEIVDPSAVIMDTPDMIVAMSAVKSLIVQAGDRRIRVTLQGERERVGDVPLWVIARSCHELVGQAQLVSYGLNYDLGIGVIGESAHQAMITAFLSGREAIEPILDGEIWSYVPRLRYRRDEAAYDLFLDPVNEQQVKVHLNVHFEATDLPSRRRLKAAFLGEFAHLESVLPRLLIERTSE